MNKQEPETGQSPSLLRHFARLLEQGEVVAFPTETFYGLLARIDRPAALERLLDLKGRSFRRPMPVIAADLEGAKSLWSSFPDKAQLLVERFWPGPLTLVLPASAKIAASLRNENGAVGVRVPGSAAARGIVAMAGAPLAATSANPSGQPPAMSPAQVRIYFGENVTVVEGPTLPPSKGSTVLDLTSWPPMLLRAGDVDRRRLEAALGVALVMRN